MDVPVPKFVAVESAALVILAAGLLLFRTFRERYLLIWIVGWLAYFVSNWTVRHPGRTRGGACGAVSVPLASHLRNRNRGIAAASNCSRAGVLKSPR